MTTAVIMQPTYLPWIGYFDLIDQADVFIFFDDAQFSKQSWHHRNRIRTHKGLEWLSVPIKRNHQALPIRDVFISDNRRFAQKHIGAVDLSYRRSKYFDQYFSNYYEIVSSGERLLAPLNIGLIKWISGELGLNTEYHLSSTLGTNGKKSALLIDICHRVGADRYLSPLGSLAYLAAASSTSDWQGIELVFHHYVHPTYHQLYDPFLPYASAIDLLFNEGDQALEIIRSGRHPAVPAAQAFEEFARCSEFITDGHYPQTAA